MLLYGWYQGSSLAYVRFNLFFRLLGAQAWKQIKEMTIFGVTAGVRLLTEDVGEKFVIEPNHANFDVLTDSAPFNDMVFFILFLYLNSKSKPFFIENLEV